jgi:hypothetical protein
MRHRLIINGGRQPREFVLIGTMVVGRDPMCDVSDSDPLLSRRHAEFVQSANDVIVRDLGSRNGILVNGVKKPEAVLHGGDVVQVGHLQVRYVEDMNAPVPAPAPPAVKSAPNTDHIATLVQPQTIVEDDARSSANTLVLPQTPDPDSVTAVLPKKAGTVVAPVGEPVAEAVDDFVRFTVPGHRVSFETEPKGWQAIGGGATTLTALIHSSGEAAIVVERAGRPDGVAGSSSALAAAETKVIRDGNPAVTKVDAVPFDDHLYTAAILNYSRPGGRGIERVFHVAFVDGPVLYRLTCSAPAARFDAFEARFTRAAATFEAGSSS